MNGKINLREVARLVIPQRPESDIDKLLEGVDALDSHTSIVDKMYDNYHRHFIDKQSTAIK